MQILYDEMGGQDALGKLFERGSSYNAWWQEKNENLLIKPFEPFFVQFLNFLALSYQNKSE